MSIFQFQALRVSADRADRGASGVQADRMSGVRDQGPDLQAGAAEAGGAGDARSSGRKDESLRRFEVDTVTECPPPCGRIARFSLPQNLY